MFNTEYELLCELEDAVNNGDLNGVLQAFAENVDFSAPLPHSVCFNLIIHRFSFFISVLSGHR